MNVPAGRADATAAHRCELESAAGDDTRTIGAMGPTRCIVVRDALDTATRDRIVAAAAGAHWEHQTIAGLAPRHAANICDHQIAAALHHSVAGRLGGLDGWETSDTFAQTAPLDQWRFSRTLPAMRIYRYTAGANFPRHRDEEQPTSAGRRTALSLLCYLPTSDTRELVGGETVIGEHIIAPHPWTIVVFAHHTEHTGATVTAGTKLVLRASIEAATNP